MQKEDFNKIINYLPDLLKIHPKELEELIERYPYFQLPYTLLAKKQHTESHPNAEIAINKAAVHIHNREKLHALIENTPLTHTAVSADGELEEIPVTTFQNILLAPNTNIDETDNENFIQEQEILPTEHENEEGTVTDLSNFMYQANEEKAPTEAAYNDTDAQLNEIDMQEESAIEREAIQEEKNTITTDALEMEYHFFDIEKEYGKLSEDEMISFEIPKATEYSHTDTTEATNYTGEKNYCEWLNMLAGDSKATVVQPDITNPPVKVSPVEKDSEFTEATAEKLAIKSIEQDIDFVTETYAKVLVMQGKTQKAIDAYRKLSLKYPDKLAYFAQKIEDLKTE